MSEPHIFAATGVAVGGRGLFLEGPPGSGKSTLAAKLIDRGAVLIGDDAVSLELSDGKVIASPPPNVAGKLELRNVGLVDCPTASAPVALLLTLTSDAPRFIDSASISELLSLPIPTLAFDPAIPASAIRAEKALERFGTHFGLPA